MACKKYLLMNGSVLNCKAGINVDNDLEAYFDNMVEACHSLVCRSKGADIDYICLHAQIQ